MTSEDELVEAQLADGTMVWLQRCSRIHYEAVRGEGDDLSIAYSKSDDDRSARFAIEQWIALHREYRLRVTRQSWLQSAKSTWAEVSL